MTGKHAQAAGYDLHLAQNSSDGNKKGKDASWVRTILWMISMALLGNVIMAIIAYFLFFYNQ